MDRKYENADLIIILGGGRGERVKLGAELYKKGCAKKVLVTGRKQHLKKQAMLYGVKEEDIICEGKSATTYENATFSLKLIKDKGYKKTILVTSSYHMRRARMLFYYFGGFRKNGIEVVPCPVKTNFRSFSDRISRALGEYIKIPYFFIFRR